MNEIQKPLAEALIALWYRPEFDEAPSAEELEEADVYATAMVPVVQKLMAQTWDEGWKHYQQYYSPAFDEFGKNPYREDTRRRSAIWKRI